MHEAEPRFRWDLRVSSDADEQATVFVRRHAFAVGLPLQFDPAYGRITALEYLLGALGADLANGLRAAAHRRRLAVDRVEALVQGELDNALTHLGVVGEPGHPGVKRIAVKIFVSSFEPEAGIRSVWEETLARSPLVHTFRDAIQLELTLQVAH
jgi:OsmC-like protein